MWKKSSESDTPQSPHPRPILKYSSSTLGLQSLLRDYMRSSPVQSSTTRGTEPQLSVPGSAHPPCMGIKGSHYQLLSQLLTAKYLFSK